MKKLVILIISLFFLTGCYDYQEINKIDIVSAIGIDYIDNKYIVTLEILNDKIEKDSAKVYSYTKVSESEDLAKAIEGASNKLSNKANYSHVKLMIISQSVAENKFKNIIDYFLRSTYFRENFYVISSFKNTPEDVLNNVTNEDPIASIAILNMLESNDYASNSAILKTFDQIIEEIIAFGIDTSFSNITLNDKQFLIDGAAIFKKYNCQTQISNEEATLYNVLTGNIYRPIFSKTMDNKYFSIAIGTGSSDISIKKDKINVNGNFTGKIMNNEQDIDVRNLKELEKINEDFTNLLNEKFANFISLLQKNECDILGISKMYYKKTREKNDKLWLNLDINTQTTFDINKKGLIYEVINEN